MNSRLHSISDHNWFSIYDEITPEEYEKLTDEEKTNIELVSKSYVVFNVKQMNGISKLAKHEQIIFKNDKASLFAATLQKNMNITIYYEGDKGFYSILLY